MTTPALEIDCDTKRHDLVMLPVSAMSQNGAKR